MQTTVVGWIPHELQLTANASGEYQMKFNIQSYDVDGNMVIVPCICEGEVAKNIERDYRKMSFISIWGQPKHVYKGFNKSNSRISNYTKVLSYSMIYDFPLEVAPPPLSNEKKETLLWIEQVAYKYLSEKETKPTEDEIKYWVDYFKKKYGGK